MKIHINEKYENYYEKIKEIGKGSYGLVYKAKEKKSNEIRAAKVINITQYKKDLENIYNETTFTEEMKSKLDKYINSIKIEAKNMEICAENNDNSAKIYEYFENENEFVIIMEFCDNNIRDILKQKNSGFNPKEIYNILMQLNNSFRKMKENQIVHRDIKLDNILVKYLDKEKKNYLIKLTDYGVSKNLNIQTTCKSNRGTIDIMAPEILRIEEEDEEKYTYKCDLWSIGIIIYELSFKKKPYQGAFESSILKNIQKNKQKYFKKTGNKKLDDLILKLLKEDVDERLNWDDYFNHPFFQKENIFLEYETKGEERVKIFGNRFVENNKNKCKIIFENKELELQEYLENTSNKTKLDLILTNIDDITDMGYLFYHCSSLVSLPDISKWDTSNVTNMDSIFFDCKSITSLPDISNWDTSNVENMSFMFYCCNSLKSLPDISNWKTNNVTNMFNLFGYCSSLSSLPDISKWSTSKVTQMQAMFMGCDALQSLPDISNWDTSNVYDMNCMFFFCDSLHSLPDISKWNISNVVMMDKMFFLCRSLTSLPDLSVWDISKLRSKEQMFYGCKSSIIPSCFK